MRELLNHALNFWDDEEVCFFRSEIKFLDDGFVHISGFIGNYIGPFDSYMVIQSFKVYLGLYFPSFLPVL